MFKEIKVKDETYFIQCSFMGDVVQCLVTNFASCEGYWSEKISKEDLLRRSKTLNPRIKYDEESVCRAISELDPTEASFEDDVHVFKVLKLKYHVENLPYKINWKLKKTPNELKESILKPLFSTVHGMKQQLDELLEVIRKKDAEIKQYKMEGAKLKRTTVETKPFNFQNFEDRYSKTTQKLKSFSKVITFLQDPEEISSSPEDTTKAKEENIKKEEANSPTKSFNPNEKQSPRAKKRKAQEAQSLHLMKKLNARQKTLDYQSSQSQSQSEDYDSTNSNENQAKRQKIDEKSSSSTKTSTNNNRRSITPSKSTGMRIRDTSSENDEPKETKQSPKESSKKSSPESKKDSKDSVKSSCRSPNKDSKGSSSDSDGSKDIFSTPRRKAPENEQTGSTPRTLTKNSNLKETPSREKDKSESQKTKKSRYQKELDKLLDLDMENMGKTFKEQYEDLKNLTQSSSRIFRNSAKKEEKPSSPGFPSKIQFSPSPLSFDEDPTNNLNKSFKEPDLKEMKTKKDETFKNSRNSVKKPQEDASKQTKSPNSTGLQTKNQISSPSPNKSLSQQSPETQQGSQTLKNFDDMSDKLDFILTQLKLLEEQRLADLKKRKIIC